MCRTMLGGIEKTKFREFKRVIDGFTVSNPASQEIRINQTRLTIYSLKLLVFTKNLPYCPNR